MNEEKKKQMDLLNKIKSLHISNFKGISDVKLDCQAINLFIGENGTGKSSAFEAIGFFFQSITDYKIQGSLADWGSFQSIFCKHNIR